MDQGLIIREGHVILPVSAQPGARKNELHSWHAGRLKIRVTQAPEKGKANRAIIDFLCRELSLKKSQIELVSGETASQKQFAIRDIAPAELLSRIEAALIKK